MKPKPIYILGTGLSHDGSACILKDGRVAVAIEKERITRRKHDGGNDTAAVQYCLDALGIGLHDLSLIVQAANFEKEIAPEAYHGKRLFTAGMPVVTISHHLAHAYSAIATSPFRESNILVIDGAGSPAQQCDDWPDEAARAYWCSLPGYYCEKDSFYRFEDNRMVCLEKDFSEMRAFEPGQGIRMPTNYHSIGGLYAAASHYCFGNMDDAGKLMGLAPYGRNTYGGLPLFLLQDGKVSIDHSRLELLKTPAAGYEAFKKDFQHYADVARWVQQETERAVAYTARCRMERFPHDHLCYAGGVALNAVSNALLLKQQIARSLYMQPAAGDNGLALGCAYYGWNSLLEREMPQLKDPAVFYGRSYTTEHITETLGRHPDAAAFKWHRDEAFVTKAAALLSQGKVIGWFREGAEFGPRALGHRSILADPRRADIGLHINQRIKFREDFRPFAPSVLKEEAGTYFENGWDSPYMILVDQVKEEWRDVMPGVVHVNGSCRVQTIDRSWNPVFYNLLEQFKALTGIGVLVNTSFNRRGMPIVETPREALDLFLSCDLDILVIEDCIITKIQPVKPNQVNCTDL